MEAASDVSHRLCVDATANAPWGYDSNGGIVGAVWRIAFHTLAVAIDPGQYFAHPLRLKAHHAE
jgi:hypothetical protein